MPQQTHTTCPYYLNYVEVDRLESNHNYQKGRSWKIHHVRGCDWQTHQVAMKKMLEWFYLLALLCVPESTVEGS